MRIATPNVRGRRSETPNAGVLCDASSLRTGGDGTTPECLDKRQRMKTTVFDASAVLVLFFDEPGAEKVELLLNKAAEDDKPILIAAANWCEVLYRMQRKRGAGGIEAAKRFERTMPLEVAPLDRELAETAAALKAEHGLGIADAFAAALSKVKKAEFVTGDLEFKALEHKITIVWIR